MLPDTLSDLTSLIAILNPQERHLICSGLHTHIPLVDEEVGSILREGGVGKAGGHDPEVMSECSGDESNCRYCQNPCSGERLPRGLVTFSLCSAK